jgi:hypothetical protein
MVRAPDEILIFSNRLIFFSSISFIWCIVSLRGKAQCMHVYVEQKATCDISLLIVFSLLEECRRLKLYWMNEVRNDMIIQVMKGSDFSLTL